MKDINQKIEIIYELLVDNFSSLEIDLKELILNPERINDTNKFASLLSELKNFTFINPLLLKISLSEKGNFWLTDFLYAVNNLFDESSLNDKFDIPPLLIDKLRIWILDNKGELAWKASNLLKFYETESSEEIQLKKLEEKDDFLLTYIKCILGLLHYNSEKHIDLVRQISLDETRDIKLREFAIEAYEKYKNHL